MDLKQAPSQSRQNKSIFVAHKVYGPIVCLATNELSIVSLEGLRQMYVGGFEKTPWYAGFIYYGTPNLVPMLWNKQHSAHKRMLSHVYTKSFVQNSPNLRVLSGVILFDRLLPLFRDTPEGSAEVYGLNQTLGIDFMAAYLFDLRNSTDFIRDVTARKEFFTNWHVFLHKLPGAFQANQKIMSEILSLCQASENEIHSSSSQMLDHLVACYENVKVTLTYMQWELSRRPSLQDALRKKLLSAFSPRGRKTQQEFPAAKDLDALPLLDSILKETLRVYPLSVAQLQRFTPDSGDAIEGFFVPGGVTVASSTCVLHKNEKAFPDAEFFMPERWLQEDETDMKRWLWAFGSGP